MTEGTNIELCIADGSFGGLTPSQLVVLRASGVSSTLARIEQFPYADLTCTVGAPTANEFALYHPGTFVADFMEVFQAWRGGNPDDINAAVERLLFDHFNYRVVFGDPDYVLPEFVRVTLDSLWATTVGPVLTRAISDAWDRPEESLRSLWAYLVDRLRANLGVGLFLLHGSQLGIVEQQPGMWPQLYNPVGKLCEPERYVFRQAGQFWRIVYDGSQEIILEDVKGIHYIHYLLKHPNQDVDVMTLVQAVEKAQPNFPTVSATEDDALELDAWDVSDQPISDKQTMKQVRAQLRDLSEQRKEAKLTGDGTILAEIDSESAKIRAKLRRAVGLGGRLRVFSHAREKARISVQKRVKSAIDRIKESNSELADHLTRSIETGYKCIYRLPGEYIAWKF